ncbi:MAG: DUF2283 domain-containing protein [Candidatus Woesearchaeota archaeon]|jgi:hypothetical protein|nr:DUF2283 domain-containing protein [Candidatus Woesearchaeota archaeon]
MNKERHLNASGKGEFLYDYKHDMLTFRIRDRDYKMSVEFQNFIIDFDTENFITGIRIFDVSKVSGLKKLIFNNLVHGDFKASIKNNIISIRLNFIGKLRNKIIPIFSSEENFTQQISAPINPKHHIQDSVVTVPEIVA